MQQILIIEDDRALNQGLCKALKTDNSSIQVSSGLYASETDRQIVSCENLKDAKEQMLCGMPSLILLDINLPDGSGLDFLQSVKMECPECPVILLTANDTDGDIVNGLELGADDYIMKPFDSKELVARVKAVLRRYQPVKIEEPASELKCVKYPDLIVNLSNYSVIYKDNPIDMPPKELELLYFLASSPNQVFTREQLLDHIWGYEYIGDTRTVDVHVKRLREKIKDHANWSLATVWGIGYKFEVRD